MREVGAIADLLVDYDDQASGVSSQSIDISAPAFASAAIFSFPAPTGRAECIEHVQLRLYMLGGEGADEAVIAVYPSSIYRAHKFREAEPIVARYGRLLDNRPKDEALVSTSEGWVEWDVTDIYRLWIKGGPFPSQARTVPSDAPFALALRPPTIPEEQWSRNFATSEANSHEPNLLIQVADPC